ncbi:MAG: hypothetical protein ACETWR_09580 [Anaerolineae bacterium]
MDTNLVIATAIGLLVFGAVYLALDVAFPSHDASVRKAKALFAGAGGLLATLSLWKDPHLLQQISQRLFWELVGIVFALLVLLRAVIRRR